MPNSSSLIDRAASLATLLLVLVIGIVIFRREFQTGQSTLKRGAVVAEEVDDWRNLAPHGILVGDPNAPVRVAEFVDFECPFCRQFHERLSQLRDSLGGRMAVLYLHLPLPSHKFARMAANASACAHNQGRFQEYHDALFAAQDSIGLKSWNEFALQAGVPDTAAFLRCVAQPTDHPVVAAGLRLADSLDVNETPTVIINQFKYSILPLDSLSSILRRASERGGR